PTADDENGKRKTAVINRTMAQTYFARRNPLGQRLVISALKNAPEPIDDPLFEIVGVVSDMKNQGLLELVEVSASLYTVWHESIEEMHVLAGSAAGGDGGCPSRRGGEWVCAARRGPRGVLRRQHHRSAPLHHVYGNLRGDALPEIERHVRAFRVGRRPRN